MSPDPGAARSRDTLEWQAAWLAVLWRRSPSRLVLVLVFLAAAAAALVLLSSTIAAAVLIAALALTLDELFFPIHFRLDTEAASARTLLRRRRHEWGEFTDVRETEFGVLLRSPVRRSLHLLVPVGKGEVLEHARTALARAGVLPPAPIR